MELTTGWTGRTACALQAALRLSNEAFAEHLGIGVRTVATWHQKPDLRPKSEMQQLLDTALERASPSAKKRFAALVSSLAPSGVPVETTTGSVDDSALTDAEFRLSADPNICAALDWLDQHADWEPGTARQQVASRLARLDVHRLRDKGSRRGRVDQRRIAHALGEYYSDRMQGYDRYGAQCGSDREILTSVLTCPNWLDLGCPLLSANGSLAVTGTSGVTSVSLADDAADGAVQRLAETLALDIRLVDTPLYRLLGIDIHHGHIGGTVGVAPLSPMP